MKKHAVFATVETRKGGRATFRVGQPVSWDAAIARWYRLDNRRAGVECPARPVTVRHDGKRYRVSTFEVRSVDTFGRGLGSERHSTALTAPYRAIRSAVR